MYAKPVTMDRSGPVRAEKVKANSHREGGGGVARAPPSQQWQREREPKNRKKKKKRRRRDSFKYTLGSLT